MADKKDRITDLMRRGIISEDVAVELLERKGFDENSQENEEEKHTDKGSFKFDFQNDKKENDDIPILFDIKVSSLFRTSLIYEFFYTLISFIESTGIYFEQLGQLKDKILEDNSIILIN